ncbi:MAG: transcriptional regulator, partial [Firmicutes bacterium]|nr:transcriptional regulator [Bacillota bacterium]
KGYIYNISSGRALPPLKEFFEICRDFKISPKEFFDTEMDDPQMVAEAMDGFKQLSEKDQQTILDLINSLKEKDK